MSKYFYQQDKTQFGPFSKDELNKQPLERRTLVWRYGLEQWTPISELPELDDIVQRIPPELEQVSISSSKEPSKLENSSRKVKTDYTIPILVLVIVAFVALIIITAVVARSRNNDDENDSEEAERKNFIEKYEEVVANSFGSDVDFQMYVDKFYRDLNYHGIRPVKPQSTIVKFSNLQFIESKTHVHGICYGKDDDSKIEIYINPESWEKFNKAQRYLVMYHELGHDVLNLDDLEDDARFEGELMFPAISSYEALTMDEFIEAAHGQFKEIKSSI
jgi:flagellar basal body-associated protein FliL